MSLFPCICPMSHSVSVSSICCITVPLSPCPAVSSVSLWWTLLLLPNDWSIISLLSLFCHSSLYVYHKYLILVGLGNGIHIHSYKFVLKDYLFCVPLWFFFHIFQILYYLKIKDQWSIILIPDTYYHLKLHPCYHSLWQHFFYLQKIKSYVYMATFLKFIYSFFLMNFFWKIWKTNDLLFWYLTLIITCIITVFG